MRIRLAHLIVLSLLLMSGCGSYYAFVDSAVDPNYSPSKTDPLYLSLTSKPSIRERQLLVRLKAELCRNKFIVVNDLKKSKWTLGLTFARETFETGVSSTATQLPGTSIVIGTAHRDLQTNQFALLHLFKSEDVAKGEYLPIWEGQVAADNETFNYYEPTIFKNLIDAFGKNVSETEKIDKKYYKSVMECSASSQLPSEPCGCGSQ